LYRYKSTCDQYSALYRYKSTFDQYSALYRYKSTYDQYSGVTTLTIYNLREEDEGEYTCKAINSLGEASTSSTLLSQGESGPLFFH